MNDQFRVERGLKISGRPSVSFESDCIIVPTAAPLEDAPTEQQCTGICLRVHKTDELQPWDLEKGGQRALGKNQNGPSIAKKRTVRKF